MRNNTKKPKFKIGQLVFCRDGDKKNYIIIAGIITNVFRKETTMNWWYNVWWLDRPFGKPYEIVQDDVAALVALLQKETENRSV